MNKNRKPALYNYTKLEFIDKIILNGIFATVIENLNDPYEFKNIASRDRYRISCLTSSHNAKLMWSHYGNKHQGCIVKIKLPKDFVISDDYILKKVNYCSIIDYENCNSDFEKLYFKDKKWKHEKEYRAVYDIENFDEKYWKIIENDVYFNVSIDKVILGCNAHLSDNYLETLQTLEKYNIKVEKMKMKDDVYKFIIDKEFDLNEEIKKYK